MPQYHVAIGGFRLRHPLLLPAFSAYAVASMRQARAAPGNVHAAARMADGRYFSLSVWDSPAAMRRFAQGGAHRRAMNAASWLGDGPFAHFKSAAIPEWDEALAEWRIHHAKGVSAPAPAG
ncbi:MAG: hypothetical protein AAGH83_11750 [Pseudomonadota bacterium]